MDASYPARSAQPTKHTQRSFPDERDSSLAPRAHHTNPHSHIDGSREFRMPDAVANMRHNLAQPSFTRISPQHHPQMSQYQVPARTNARNPPPRQSQAKGPTNAATDILPYCTTEPPLRPEHVIALSDVVGSVKELVLLAIGAAAGDGVCADKMDAAVGAQATGCIVDFFAGEWEVE